MSVARRHSGRSEVTQSKRLPPLSGNVVAALSWCSWHFTVFPPVFSKASAQVTWEPEIYGWSKPVDVENACIAVLVCSGCMMIPWVIHRLNLWLAQDSDNLKKQHQQRFLWYFCMPVLLAWAFVLFFLPVFLLRAVHVTDFTSSRYHILTASDDYTCRLWDIPNATELTTFQEHTDYIRCGVPSKLNTDLFITGEQGPFFFNVRGKVRVQFVNGSVPGRCISNYSHLKV